MGAFEQLFGPVREEFEQKFSKNSNAQGVARGDDVEASIWLVHKQNKKNVSEQHNKTYLRMK